MNRTLPWICAALLVAGTAVAQTTFVESFDGGSNEGGWTYFAPSETIEMSGGNPGAYLHAWNIDTFAPSPQTTEESIFTGDYRAMGVTTIGVDLITHAVDFSAERELSILLYSDNDTPGDFDDDWAAYYISDQIVPSPGEGWREFEFDIPSQSMALPQGWGIVTFGPDSPEDPDWNDVITSVDRLGFFYGDPTGFFIFQMWDIGLDNPRITYEGQPVAIEETTWGRIKGTWR